MASKGAGEGLELQFETACDLHQVRPAAERVHAFLSEQGCSNDEIVDCELALVEACTNAILYARPESRQQPVGIRVCCAPARIEMIVTDHTVGFDWNARVGLPGPESESGRGVYLIKALMDFSEYHCGGPANTLVLHKTRQGASPRSGAGL